MSNSLQKRAGVSMLRLKKSEDIPSSEVLKRAMSMMRLRRGLGGQTRQVRGPSMMRLKRLPIFKDMEGDTLCSMYPDYCWRKCHLFVLLDWSWSSLLLYHITAAFLIGGHYTNVRSEEMYVFSNKCNLRDTLGIIDQKSSYQLPYNFRIFFRKYWTFPG